MANKKEAVGVLLLSKNVEGELVAVLQVRGTWNPEKNAPESYPGACQVTAFGGLEGDETLLQALWREIGEELGAEFVPIISQLHNDGKLVELVSLDTPEKLVVNFGVIIKEAEALMLLAKEKSLSSGGFRLIHRNEVDKVVDLKTFSRETGVQDETVTAMFSDGRETLRIAFEKFG